MIRHHALTGLIMVAIAVAMVRCLNIDAAETPWNPQEGSAKLFSRQEDIAKKPPIGLSPRPLSRSGRAGQSSGLRIHPRIQSRAGPAAFASTWSR